jgi:NADH dehydrogenase FAD-containing subunit
MWKNTITFEEVWNDSETRPEFITFLQQTDATNYQNCLLCEQIDEINKLDQPSERYDRTIETYAGFEDTNVSPCFLEMLDDILTVCSHEYFSAKAFTKLQQEIFKQLKLGPFRKFLSRPKEETETDEQSDSEAHVVLSDEFSEFLMENDRISEIITDMKDAHTGVPTKDHSGIPYSGNLFQYKNCFSGKDLVTWVRDYMNSTREEAISILHFLQRKEDLFKSVNKRQVELQDSSSKLFRFKKRVVIVGGGFSGLVAARKLQDEFTVILITSRSHFECTPDYPHLISDPSYLQQIRYDYKRCLVNTQIVYDKVEYITIDHIVFSGEKKYEYPVMKHDDQWILEYDYLIVGTGRRITKTFSVNMTVERRASVINPYNSDEIVANNEQLKNAKRITIVGAGAMGVEICGECATTFKNATIVLMTESKKILPNTPPLAQQSTLAALKRFKNVQIMTECTVVELENRSVWYVDAQNTQKVMETDILFQCNGTVPNSELFEKYFAHALDNRTKEVVVDQHFRVHQGTVVTLYRGNNIFAIGDMTNIKEPKVSNLAMNHGKLVAKVISGIEMGLGTLPKYEPGKDPVRVTLGKDDSLIVRKDEMITNPIIKYKYNKKLKGNNMMKSLSKSLDAA